MNRLDITLYWGQYWINGFIVTMTIWTPDLTLFEGPLYLKLVKAIEQAFHKAVK